MKALGERFCSAGFPTPSQLFVDEDDLRGAFEELGRLGLVARKGEHGSRCHLTETGRSWILESRGLVVVFCPKCSTDEYVPRGLSSAQASCHVCGVGWVEDTTREPFAPRY